MTIGILMYVLLLKKNQKHVKHTSQSVMQTFVFIRKLMKNDKKKL